MRFKGWERSKGLGREKCRDRLAFWFFILVVSIIVTIICFNNQDNLLCGFLIYPCAFGIVFGLGGICEYSFRYFQAKKEVRK